MRRFVIGDIHGAHRALLQCFERSGFDRRHDLLICLGDLCDGWSEVNRVFDELLDIRSMVLLLGNHDRWLLQYWLTGNAPDSWLDQGGEATLRSVEQGDVEAYKELLKEARLYYELDNNLFVHGGILTHVPLDQQDEDVFLWDRSLVKRALVLKQLNQEINLTRYSKVFVGHTPTINFGSTEPIAACEVYLMDTGAGWPGGVLTMMDIDRGKFYQSKPVDRLYPGISGRI
jgi:serine/threonine protein phosphatase 1